MVPDTIFLQGQPCHATRANEARTSSESAKPRGARSNNPPLVLLGRGVPTKTPDPLYLSSMLVNDTVVRRSGCDRPLAPWSCETVEKHGRHIHILNKPEQLRGLAIPHRKDGTQDEEAGFSEPSVVACVPLSTQGRLCMLDIQDSCFSHRRTSRAKYKGKRCIAQCCSGLASIEGSFNWEATNPCLVKASPRDSMISAKLSSNWNSFLSRTPSGNVFSAPQA